MALHDLERHLERDGGVVPEAEQPNVLQAIYNSFSERERHSEVHTNAVRVLGPLIRKLTDRNQENLVVALADIVVAPRTTTATPQEIAVMRENASMGLRGIAEALTSLKDRPETAKTAQAAVNRLVQGLGTKIAANIRAEVYDVLAELVEGYGKQLAELHGKLQQLALEDIAADASVDGSTRKKASTCLARLSVHTTEDQFAVVLKFVTDGLKAASGEKLRQYVLLINTLSRTAASRFGSSVEVIVALFLGELRRLNALSEEAKESPESDGTREQIFQCLESFVGRCSGFMGSLLQQVIQSCLEHVAWDPNFCDDGVTGDEALDDDGDEEEICEDDSDVSWRVRKASAKCLAELFRSREDLLADNIRKIVLEGKLYLRFRERVEQVLGEILEVVAVAVRSCKVILPASFDKSMASPSAVSGSFAGGSHRTVVEHKEESKLFAEVKDKMMQQLVTLCSHKVPHIKLSAFVIIRDLLVILGTDIASSIPQCVAAARSQLTLSVSHKLLPQLRTEVVTVSTLLCSIAVKSGVPQYHQDVEQLVGPILGAISDRNLKTVVAALTAADELVNVALSSQNSVALSKQIFDAVASRLKAVDADQDVKRAATKAMATVLVQLEASLSAFSADVALTHDLLLLLMKNETTRIAAIQCVVAIIRTRISETVILGFVAELVSFLRKTDRNVREAAVRALAVIVRLHPAAVQKSRQNVDAIIQELGSENAALLSDKELFLAGLSLTLAEVLVSIPSAQPALLNIVAPATFRLLRGPLSQGQVLTNASLFLRKLAHANGSSYGDLLAMTTAEVKTATAVTLPNIAVAVGAVVAADPDESRRKKSTASFCQTAEKVVGLCCLGEIGHAGCVLPQDARDYILSGMTNQSEDIRSVAIRALGRAASTKANADLLDRIATAIVASSGEAFYFFRAIKEAIAASTNGDSTSSLADAATRAKIQRMLLTASNRDDDSLIDIIGECIGRLAPFDFSIMDSLADAIRQAQSQIVQATVVCGVKYAVSSLHSRADEEAVARQLPVFLGVLQRSATVSLRRSVLQLLSTLAIARPRLLLTDLSRTHTIPALIAELAVDKALVSDIDLGPFKHRVDKGAEMRKIAFETLVTLVDGLFRTNPVLDMAGAIEQVVHRIVLSLALPTEANQREGAEFETDIHNQCRSMLAKLQRYPAAQPHIMSNLPLIIKLLSAAMDAKAKEKQEQEKVEDSIKYAIFCAVRLKAMGTIPHDLQKPFNELIKKAESHERYKDALAITH